MVTIRRGHAEVLVAKRNTDGSISRRCVSSSEEGEAFWRSAPTMKAAEQ